MKRETRAVLGRSVLGFALSWGLACGGGAQVLDEGDPSSAEQPSQSQTDVCAGAQGLGSYKAYLCPSTNIVSIQLSSCQAARANCEFNASSNSNSSLYCTWKGMEIYRREKIAGTCPR